MQLLWTPYRGVYVLIFIKYFLIYPLSKNFRIPLKRINSRFSLFIFAKSPILLFFIVIEKSDYFTFRSLKLLFLAIFFLKPHFILLFNLIESVRFYNPDFIGTRALHTSSFCRNLLSTGFKNDAICAAQYD